jgi:SecD/SecF fusion protein
MSEKGIVKWLLIAIVFVCLLQFIYYIPTNKIERQADEYAEQYSAGSPDENSKQAAFKAGRIKFLDSVSSEKTFSIPLIKDYTYADLKKQQLALGLDLKGGMSTILQIDLKDLLVSLSGNSQDPIFKGAMAKAAERMKSSQSDFISLFVDEFKKQGNGKTLASIFSRGATLKDRVKFETPDIDVARILRQIANETVDLTFKRLKDRIDKIGVTQPNVSLDKARDMIVVELPGIDNPARARKYLQASAKLEFWEVYRNVDPGVFESIVNADKKLKAISKGDTSSVIKDDYVLKNKYTYTTDSVGTKIDSTLIGTDTIRNQDPMSEKGPLLSLFTPASSAAGGYAVIGVVEKSKRARFLELINMPELKNVFPADMEFRIESKPQKQADNKQSNTYNVYAIKKRPGATAAPLDGEHVVRATANPDNLTGDVVVSLSMDNKGAKIWGDMTTKAANDNKREIAILLDDEIVSCPSVREPILGGSSQIAGNFTIDEAKDLANILQVGKLPAKTQIVQESLIGPSLGKENISKSLWSILGGFLLVMLFMVLYYTGGGFFSIIALMLNILFILATLASFGTVLTLPGIAGLVLTMGMSVDANVVIYERIKEELTAGRSLFDAIKEGFRNSYAPIIDAHVTNLLTCIVLFIYGLGAIKGFAIVLIIGIIFSLFTSVLVTRLMIDWWLGKGKKLGFASKVTEHAFKNINVDWVGGRKYAYIFSIILITISFISFFTRGFELGVEFKGGYSYNVSFDKEIDAEKLRTSLSKSFEGNPVVKSVDTKNTYNITTSYLINETGEDVVDRVNHKLHDGINEAIGENVDYETFINNDGRGTHITAFSRVGPIIADDIKASAYKSILIALLVIFVYILLRFNKWQYSLGSIVALFHDTVVVLGAFSLFHGILPFAMEVDQTLIAAVLTVIGYSMNDTVIVFDRIKEFLSQDSQKSDKELVNAAINTTLSRTINTSLATLLTIVLLFFFGGSSTKGFCFAMIVGIIIGTFSSICVAMPVVIDFTKNLKYTTRKETKKITKQVARV